LTSEYYGGPTYCVTDRILVPGIEVGKVSMEAGVTAAAELS